MESKEVDAVAGIAIGRHHERILAPWSINRSATAM
jgi:hypothetical protein